jgi:NifU-like protein involved in Fe-S cluster formation
MAKYSETLTDHVMSPRNGGVIENPDLIGHAQTAAAGTNTCGERSVCHFQRRT